jgi:Tfp pilus assembly protein PilO
MMRFLFPIFLVIIGLVIALTFTLPEYHQVQALQAEASTYDNALSKVTELAETRQALFEKYADLSDGGIKDRLDKLLPSNVDNVRLLIEVDSIANRYGMTIRDVDFLESQNNAAAPGQESPNSLYKDITFRFSVKGSYTDFLFFMRDLERSLRLVDVDHIAFSANEQVVGENTYDVSLKAYWLAQDAILDDTPAASPAPNDNVDIPL